MIHSAIASLNRTTQAYCAQICEKQTLTFGIAYFNQKFSVLADACQFREVVVEESSQVSDAFSEAERFFADHDMRCLRWAPAVDQAVEPLEAFLTQRGFVRQEYAALALTRWVDEKPVEGVRILPARAMRTAMKKTFPSSGPSGEDSCDLSYAVCEQRLDDPPYDLFLAMVDGQPAGRCALYQVGDIARVMDLFVLPPFHDQGVDRALLIHALALAKRLAIRNIVTQVQVKDTTSREQLEALGFSKEGSIVEFERAPSNGGQPT